MVNIPPTAIVATQQDPYSPTILTSVEDAREIANAANVRFGGRRGRRRTQKQHLKRRSTRRLRKSAKN